MTLFQVRSHSAVQGFGMSTCEFWWEHSLPISLCYGSCRRQLIQGKVSPITKAWPLWCLHWMSCVIPEDCPLWLVSKLVHRLHLCKRWELLSFQLLDCPFVQPCGVFLLACAACMEKRLDFWFLSPMALCFSELCPANSSFFNLPKFWAPFP